ncbi:MAG: hypothetical protein Q8L24_01300, partial [bacterium]|nr:hypothetical protein [bacterium]
TLVGCLLVMAGLVLLGMTAFLARMRMGSCIKGDIIRFSSACAVFAIGTWFISENLVVNIVFSVFDLAIAFYAIKLWRRRRNEELAKSKQSPV